MRKARFRNDKPFFWNRLPEWTIPAKLCTPPPTLEFQSTFDRRFGIPYFFFLPSVTLYIPISEFQTNLVERCSSMMPFSYIIANPVNVFWIAISFFFFFLSVFLRIPRTLCRISCILGTKCVTCSYIDKFAPFHNQMSVIYNIFAKFL